MQSNSIINGQQMNSKRIGEDMRVFFAAASAATLAICIATPCYAQADNGPIDSESEPEIIVTGVLTATSIEKAPIAITALSGEALSQQAPGITVTGITVTVHLTIKRTNFNHVIQIFHTKT
jgi:outer membrane receptor protein involved in Fe transport